MEVKLLIILSLFFGSSLGQIQQIKCVYGGSPYICTLTVQDPQGFNNFTYIEGTHEAGKSNADVVEIRAVTSTSYTTNFPYIICATFPNLEKIYFGNMKVEKLTEDSFAGCNNIVKIVFSSNKINEIHPNALNLANLADILLGDNQLETLDENVFSAAVALKYLSLNNNPLKNLPGNIFENNLLLEELIMHKTQLNEINSKWIAPLVNLRTLVLNNNSLTTIPEQLFSNNANLHFIDIRNNPFGTLPSGLFNGLQLLEHLYLTDTGITEVKPQWFDSLGGLTTLLLDKNGITNIPEHAFDNLQSLEIINLSDNMLTEAGIPGDLFINMPQLRYFRMDNNKIKTINPQWFQNTKNIISLSLKFNNIDELQIGVFSTILNFLILNLSGNNLVTINRDSFGGLQKMYNADLSGNKINAIDERFFIDSSALFNLHLATNICVSKNFDGFKFSQNKPILQTCIDNFNNLK